MNNRYIVEEFKLACGKSYWAVLDTGTDNRSVGMFWKEEDAKKECDALNSGLKKITIIR